MPENGDVAMSRLPRAKEAFYVEPPRLRKSEDDSPEWKGRGRGNVDGVGPGKKELTDGFPRQTTVTDDPWAKRDTWARKGPVLAKRTIR